MVSPLCSLIKINEKSIKLLAKQSFFFDLLYFGNDWDIGIHADLIKAILAGYDGLTVKPSATGKVRHFNRCASLCD